MPSPASGPEASARAAALTEYAAGATKRVFADSPSADGVIQLIRKLHRASRADASTASECAKCARGQIATALISELIPIQRMIDSLDEVARRHLEELAESYRSESLPYRNGRISQAQITCPFAENGLCRLGEDKPFSCAFDDERSSEGMPMAYEFGHALGLCLSGYDHHRVELGLAVGKMLEDPAWIDRYLAREHVFWEEGRFAAFRSPVVERARDILGSEEPAGAPPFDEQVQQAEVVEKERGVAAMQAVLLPNTTLRKVLHLRIPEVVHSEEEIDFLRERFVQRLRAFVAMNEHPSEIVDALRHFHLFPLAYHGREVKSILREVGRTLIAPAIARSLPDLARPIEPRKRKGRLRVGYLSANLRQSNGGVWSIGWLRNHPEDFETYAFFTYPRPDPASLLFRRAADHYFELPSDVPTTARFIKSIELDVLIFTDIGMDMLNTIYAGMRLAPIQATAWGHPVTSGLPTIDYYLSSDWMEPSSADDHYTEKLVRLPESGLFIKRSPPSVSKLTRADFGFGESFLALVPQNPMKLIPREDAIFAKISEKLGVPLVFVEGQVSTVSQVTRERLAKAGVNAKWVPFQTHMDFLRLIELADAVIDVPAWNGGNTTLHSLAFKKPVVTLPGEFMRGRHSLAFLRQANMDSLIAFDKDEFVRLACDREAHSRAAGDADFDGPFECKKAVEGLNEWLRLAAGS